MVLAPLARAVAALALGTGLASCGGTPPGGKPPAQESPSESPSVPAEAPAPSQDGGAAPAAPGPAASSDVAPRRGGGVIEISAPVVKGKLAGDESVERMIRATENGLKACYERGLENDPAAGGVVEFRINVTDSGVIKRVESANPSTMPGSVTTCMVGRFGALSFNAAGASTIDVKVTCRRAE